MRDRLIIEDRNYEKQILEICEKYDPVQNKKKTTKIQTTILFKNEQPIYQRPRRLSQLEKIEIDKQIEKWLEEGINNPNNSEFVSPTVQEI